jgi:hypothetical protein
LSNNRRKLSSKPYPESPKRYRLKPQIRTAISSRNFRASSSVASSAAALVGERFIVPTKSDSQHDIPKKLQENDNHLNINTKIKFPQTKPAKITKTQQSQPPKSCPNGKIQPPDQIDTGKGKKER